MKTVEPPSADEARTLPATVDVVTAARYFGLGRDAGYEAARTGSFPCQVLRIGGRYRVTRSALMHALGLTDPGDSLASGVNPQVSATASDA